MFKIKISFFIMGAILVLSCLYPAAYAEKAAPAFGWGINGHPLTQSGYFDVDLRTQVELVTGLGAGWYRFDLGPLDFAASTNRLDDLLNEAEKAKIQLLPVLVPFLGTSTDGTTPEGIQAAAFTFAQAVVGRYKGRISHWELGNELDGQALLRKGDMTRRGTRWEWGDPDGSLAEDYAEVRYQRAKAVILGLQQGAKAADPSVVTLVDTAGWLHYGFIERLVNEDHVPFDVLAWHWYSEMGDITRVQGKLNLLEYLKRYGKPIWITEINRRNGSAEGKDRELTEFITGTVAKLGANPGIGGLFIYELLDEPYFGENGESHYGLAELTHNAQGKWEISQRKAAFAAYKSVIAAAQGETKPSK